MITADINTFLALTPKDLQPYVARKLSEFNFEAELTGTSVFESINREAARYQCQVNNAKDDEELGISFAFGGTIRKLTLEKDPANDIVPSQMEIWRPIDNEMESPFAPRVRLSIIARTNGMASIEFVIDVIPLSYANYPNPELFRQTLISINHFNGHNTLRVGNDIFKPSVKDIKSIIPSFPIESLPTNIEFENRNIVSMSKIEEILIEHLLTGSLDLKTNQEEN